ncbi:MAG: ABC transporter permease subunit [Clostridiaceae bacterium]|nr:ABC transporter permease subunit [Clostridiaceae bacterium]
MESNRIAQTAVPDLRRHKKNKIIDHYRKYWVLHLMALPTIVLVFLFSYAPMFGIVVAFQDYKAALGVFGSKFTGLKNFEFLFASTDAWNITRNTIVYNVIFIVMNFFLSILLAILFSEMWSKKLYKTLQTIYIMPNFLSYAVVSMIVYAFLNGGCGYLNTLLESMGFEGQNWYQTRSFWPGFLIFLNAWKSVGWSSIIYTATITGISMDYYEAAMLDGASKIQQAIHITIPHLKYIMIILFIMSIGSIFHGDFGLFYTVPQNNGYLYPVTDVIDTYIYRALTQMTNTGMSMAASLYQSVVGFVMIILSNWLVRVYDPESSLF